MEKMVSRSPVEQCLHGAPQGDAVKTQHATRWAQMRQKFVFLTRGEWGRALEQRCQVAPRTDVTPRKHVQAPEAAQEYDVGRPRSNPGQRLQPRPVGSASSWPSFRTPSVLNCANGAAERLGEAIDDRPATFHTELLECHADPHCSHEAALDSPAA
jgi:hypothetical protein